MVSSASLSKFVPDDVVSRPPVRLADPVWPVDDELHLLDSVAAVNCSWPDRLTLSMVAELETVAPGVPWVLTSIFPELKMMAGPNRASPSGAVPVTGAAEPPAGSCTVGTGPRT